MTDWVYCPKGQGYLHGGLLHEPSTVSSRLRHFNANAVGIKLEVGREFAVVWLIGTDETWNVPVDDVCPVDVVQTGDKWEKKICNICHCLLAVEEFALNQTNKHGPIRRPTCKNCRTDIDKRAPKSQQAKRAEKNRPKKGTAFQCPICQKRSIVGITAKIVADHNHHTGDIRDFICDSCNTGLGRFKNGKDCLKDALAYIEEREYLLDSST